MLPKAATLSLQDYLCPATRPRFLNDMRTSLTELGTFYIKDHGVSPALIQNTMAIVRDYFSLPLNEKKKMLIGNTRHFRGYKLMAVALSLDLDADYFRNLFGLNPYYRLKCAKYPSVAQGKSATIGCGAHKDTGFLTVLLQDMVGGLQGQDPVSGEWMDTRPIPDTFIVTLGESIERLTDGAYQATVHRVLNNTSGQDRYSIPFFFDPALDAQIPSRLKESGKNKVMMIDSENASLEDLVEGLNIHDGLAPYPKKDTQTWSNGEHIFETVHRCHPEVYSRWYGREA
ncbi:hypothetical protein BGZ59_007110 [Podila verticillata]|nr:hypothetical protein BGZ59_007110 [Podila verticillata]